MYGFGVYIMLQLFRRINFIIYDQAHYCTSLAQFIEHLTGNLRIVSSNLTLAIGKHGSLVHPVVKWVATM